MRALRGLSGIVDRRYACPPDCRRDGGRCITCAGNIVAGWNGSSDFGDIRSAIEREEQRRADGQPAAALGVIALDRLANEAAFAEGNSGSGAD